MPMLADFALRLSGGLAGLVLLSPWRDVPVAFFRTLCQIILALVVLAALDLATTGAGGAGPAVAVAVSVGAAVVAYLASVCWGLGLPRLGVPLAAGLLGATGAILVAGSRGPSPAVWALNAAGRLASAFLLGASLTAMLLGHHYLTAPAMSIAPLRRCVRSMGVALGVRAALAAVGLGIWTAGELPSAAPVEPLFLVIRWGMGIVGPALAVVLAWQTVRIRSTQSATGILYIGTTLVLFGELTALVLARGAGIVF